MPYGKWFLTTISYSQLCLSYQVIVTTDDTCHLWLRWSHNQPQRHPIARVLRGLAVMGDVYYCFTAYHDIEQDEAGDTLTHTFTFTDWSYCETRFFYFHGTVTAVASPSTSPIITHHHLAPLTQNIGSQAIDRSWRFGHASLKFVAIEGANPATLDGLLCLSKVWCFANPGNPLKIGTFYQVAPNRFTLRDAGVFWTPLVGYNEHAESITIKAGDYIGFLLFQLVYIDWQIAGGTEYWYVQSDAITLLNTLCIHTPNALLSLQGVVIQT